LPAPFAGKTYFTENRSGAVFRLPGPPFNMGGFPVLSRENGEALILKEHPDKAHAL